MRFATLREYAEEFFTPASRPTMATLRKWAESGELPGARKIGGLWFVDLDRAEHDDTEALVEKILCS